MSAIEVEVNDQFVGNAEGNTELAEQGEGLPAVAWWSVDSRASTFEFQGSRRFGFGLLRGKFREATGTFELAGDLVHGSLEIDVRSIDMAHALRDRRSFSHAVLSDHHHSVAVTVERGVLHPNGVLSLQGTVEFGETSVPLRCRARVLGLDTDEGRATADVELFLPAASSFAQRHGLPLKDVIIGNAHLALTRLGEGTAAERLRSTDLARAAAA
jgi:hypothetical protein